MGTRARPFDGYSRMAGFGATLSPARAPAKVGYPPEAAAWGAWERNGQTPERPFEL